MNMEHSLIAVGWLDNKPVNFISTADTTEIVSVERRIKHEKVKVPAPVVVKNLIVYLSCINSMVKR